MVDKLTPQQFKLVFLSSLGGMLEFYDFVIFAIFATYIGHSFFPDENHVISLLSAFATFAVGYLARPIGGMIFSHFGDKYGRKYSFIASILIMAVATIVMAFLPGYDIGGMTMSVIFILLRILQGLAIGGEIPGAITYVVEHMKKRPAFACGMVFLFINMGVFLATGTHAVLAYLLTDKLMVMWGWRIAFLIGGVLALFSYFLRRDILESPEFQMVVQKKLKLPIITLLKNNLPQLLSGSILVALPATIISVVFLYMTSYLTLVGVYSTAEIAQITMIGLIVFSGSILIWGIISDCFNSQIVFLISIILLGVTSYWFYANLSQDSHPLLSYLIYSVICGMSLGSLYPVLAFMFITQVRYSGVAFCYNVAFALFGGLTPFFATYFISIMGSYVAPSFILIFISIMAFLSILYVILTNKSKRYGK